MAQKFKIKKMNILFYFFQKVLNLFGIKSLFTYLKLKAPLVIYFSYIKNYFQLNESNDKVALTLYNGLFSKKSKLEIVAKKVYRSEAIKVSVKSSIYGKETFGWEDENNREEYVLFLKKEEIGKIKITKSKDSWTINFYQVTLNDIEKSQQVKIKDNNFYFFHRVKRHLNTSFFIG